MAAPTTTTHTTADRIHAPKNGLTLVWLDDNSTQDVEAKDIFLSIFEQVFCFNQPLACLELVESADAEPPCISILVSGRYGQMYVQNRFQPLNQVKDIYVYCMDIVRHSQWAQLCDKVRCVESDFAKIFQRMQQDVMRGMQPNHQPQPQPQHQHQHQQPQHHHPLEQQPMEVENPQEHEPEPPQEEYVPKPPERFKNDNNIYDQLALHLLLKKPTDNDDGAEDFKKYCQAHTTTDHEGEEHQYFRPELPLEEWYKPDLFYARLNITDLTQLWTLRWFIRIFHEQLNTKQDYLNPNISTFTVHYGTWVTTSELDKIKQRIGTSMICNELLLAYTNKDTALQSLGKKTEEQSKHKIIFEINVDTRIHSTVPYGEITKEKILFWFGSRHRLIKIEFIDEGDPYWSIGLNLCSTLNSNQSIQDLYEYYEKYLTNLNDTYQAFGKLFMYKGLYYQAEKWFENTTYYEELAELALRQNICEQACQYLEKLPPDSHSANLLRAYVYLLISNDNITKGKTSLMTIYTDATDEIIRARAGIALGYIDLVVTQNIDQALKYFTSAYETLSTNLPDIHPDIAKSLIGIGYAHFMKTNINEAEKTFRKAFQIQDQYLPNNHPDFAKSRIGLAHCLAVNAQTARDALQELGIAINILIRTYRRNFKNHPEILLTRKEIERVQKGKELCARNLLFDYI